MKSLPPLLAACLFLPPAPARAEEAASVVKLRGEYQAARAAALAQVNGSFATEADAVLKQYLQATDLPGANRTADFAKNLRDADEKNDLEGLGPLASPTDRLGNLEDRYVRAREETLRKLNQTFARPAGDLRAAAMRAGDLATANQATAFLEQLKAVPAPAPAPPGPLDPSPNARGLLAKGNEKKWEIRKGEWKTDGDLLTGAGDSLTTCHEHFQPPFTLRFKIKVLEGSRPRVKFGPFSFANEGYETTFGLYPKSDGRLFHYERNTEYKVALVVNSRSVDLFIDDKLISKGPGVKERMDAVDFMAGDGFSKGRVEYRDILVTK